MDSKNRSNANLSAWLKNIDCYCWKNGMSVLRDKIKNLRFRQGRLELALEDGRRVSVPLDWYPTLKTATAKQRNEWKTCGAGTGVHWTILDYHLSAEGILKGLKEAKPMAPAA